MKTQDQWENMKTLCQENMVNMAPVVKLVEIILEIVKEGGYGSIQISILGGLLQEIKITQTKRIQQPIIQDIGKD